MYPTKPARPIGVTLAAVLLGIFSGFLVLGGLGSAAFSLLAKTLLAAQPASATPAPPAGFMSGMFIVIALFYLLLAGWGISTTVGLVRLRNWARISTIIIGAGLVLIGLVSILGTLMAQHMMASGQVPNTTANPGALRAILLAYTVLWLLVVAVGIWFIAYFAIRRTRDAFRAAALPPTPAGYEALPLPYAAQPAAFGAHDFYYAEPTNTPADAAIVQPVYPMQPVAVQTAAPRRTRPVSMVVIGILMLLGAVPQLIFAMMWFPFLLFGVELHGAAAKVVLAILGLATLYAGIGLIKLWKPAWVTAVAVLAFSAVNCVVSILPGNVAKLRAISHEFSAHLNSSIGMAPNPAANPLQPIFESDGFYRIMYIFSLLLIALYLVLLWRARWAYEPGAMSPASRVEGESGIQ